MPGFKVLLGGYKIQAAAATRTTIKIIFGNRFLPITFLVS
jgi:hypothetical protein